MRAQPAAGLSHMGFPIACGNTWRAETGAPAPAADFATKIVSDADRMMLRIGMRVAFMVAPCAKKSALPSCGRNPHVSQRERTLLPLDPLTSNSAFTLHRARRSFLRRRLHASSDLQQVLQMSPVTRALPA